MNELKFQFWGWILFVICAILFTASGVRARDLLTTAASLIFLMACIVFMIPLVRELRKPNKE